MEDMEMRNAHLNILIALAAELVLCPAAGNEQFRFVPQGEKVMWLNRPGDLNIRAASTLAPAAFWSGLIDDVRVYDRAVKPETKQSIFSALKAGNMV
jgi:hypothetical protein